MKKIFFKLTRPEKIEMLKGTSGRLSLMRYSLYESRHIKNLTISVGLFGLVYSILKSFEPGLTPSVLIVLAGLGIDMSGKGAKAIQRHFEGNRNSGGESGK